MSMKWRTDKPTGRVVVAKLSEDFAHNIDRYAILYYVPMPYPHYSEDGEEIPYGAIEKWASLEEDN